jgi:hypothetical protein
MIIAQFLRTFAHFLLTDFVRRIKFPNSSIADRHRERGIHQPRSTTANDMPKTDATWKVTNKPDGKMG